MGVAAWIKGASPGISLRAFTGLLIFRIVNALLIQTFYVPDEYWQSLEVAHHLVFGYGYLTWEWEERIRGFFHPLLFALPYAGLKILALDTRATVIAAPKVLQAFFAAVGDAYFHRLARRVVGREAADWATFAYLTNHFALFSLPRTLSNSLETILSVVALAFFPWRAGKVGGSGGEEEEEDVEEEYTDDAVEAKESRDVWMHLAVAALTVVVRPTAVVTWIPLWLPRLFSKKIAAPDRRRFFLRTVAVGVVAVVASCALDSFCYGRFTFVPWEFLKLNVVRGVADFYGSHPFHWYITQGFPVLLGPHLPPFLAALHLIWRRKFAPRVDRALEQYRQMQRKKEQKQKMKQKQNKKEKDAAAAAVAEERKAAEPTSDLTLVKIIFWIIVVYSFLGHKEFRFIFTAVPLAMCLVGKYYASLGSGWPTKKFLMIGVVSLLNAGAFLYLALFHQRGNLDAVAHLADRLDAVSQRERDGAFVLFLLPCHQHPFYSHLHRRVEMRFLNCDPPLKADQDRPGFDNDYARGDSRVDTYKDEADEFFSDPENWFRTLLSGGGGGGAGGAGGAGGVEGGGAAPAAPTHLIMSQKTGLRLTTLLIGANFTKTKSFFHSHLEMDARVGTELELYERNIG